MLKGQRMKPLSYNKGKNFKRKQHEMERLQKRVPKVFKVYEEAKVNILTALAS